MILRSLRMRNIRSYIDELIDFPEATTLLSGDIGGGKTTVLLAIEFAIFGVMKGILSGGALLRHGANHGSVELSMEVEGKPVTIKRSLKRGSLGIVQEPGELIVSGKRFEGTPQELKSKMLELLGYPESLLTKSKSLIFRYTVFTPQEEMKRILYESKEDRLDILRKLFDIDKYRRVKENVINYVRELKSSINVMEGRLESLSKQAEEKAEYEDNLKKSDEQLKKDSSELEKKKEAFESAKQSLGKAEQELDSLRKDEKELAATQAELTGISRQFDRSQSELRSADSSIQSLLKDMGGFDITKGDIIAHQIKGRKDDLKKIQEKLSDANSKRSENLTKKSSAESIIAKITKLDKCPTCQQKVTPEHISEVTGQNKVIVKNCEINLTRIEEIEGKLKERRKAYEEELEKYLADEKELSLKKAKADRLKELQSRKAELEKESNELKSLAAKKSSSLQTIINRMEACKDKKASLESAKKELERRREEKQSTEQDIIKRKAKQESLKEIIGKIEREISKLKLEKQELERKRQLSSWLSAEFLHLTNNIERSILARIYNEFNTFFQEWFSMLIEDETISVRLDDSFSPEIEQNGYETWLENLSGGEKTSVALAYRLSLNKVINDFMSSIKTRDLIILDEPTEGFSSEQLDRVRDVLHQTKVRQVIIVSHEAKMEGFVDNIIRIKKEGHESRVMK